MSETDLELLKRYAGGHAEDAFAEIVHRHLNLVYSAALRQVRSPQLAEEVAQSAFMDLARNGLLLRPRRKARANWAKAFRRPPRLSDGLAAFRELTNELDRKEWAW